MAANRLEGMKQGDEASRNGKEAKETPVKSGGGLKAWIPLVANIVLMPAIAYGLTTFVLLPKLNGASKEKSHEEAPAEEHGNAGKSESRGKSGKPKVTASLGGKILVNVAGTMGTRYLVASMTLVGTSADLKHEVEEHDAQLRDAAAGILAAKTISDLEKPGVRNMVRMELISAFNDILGHNIINDLYLTEFAIQ